MRLRFISFTFRFKFFKLSSFPPPMTRYMAARWLSQSIYTLFRLPCLPKNKLKKFLCVLLSEFCTLCLCACVRVYVCVDVLPYLRGIGDAQHHFYSWCLVDRQTDIYTIHTYTETTVWNLSSHSKQWKRLIHTNSPMRERERQKW